MKTVKIILKFKFLTLFSDKIIQCYTESTVYTIITLFLYGIGANISLPNLDRLIITLFLYGIGAINNTVFRLVKVIITLFLYGIGANVKRKRCTYIYLLHYSYMELELLIETKHFLHQLYYIIPIWNWSLFREK